MKKESFRPGKSYKAKSNLIGRTNGCKVAKANQVLTCISDGHSKRLAYWTENGSEISWSVSQFNRKDFFLVRTCTIPFMEVL